MAEEFNFHLDENLRQSQNASKNHHYEEERKRNVSRLAQAKRNRKKAEGTLIL